VAERTGRKERVPFAQRFYVHGWGKDLLPHTHLLAPSGRTYCGAKPGWDWVEGRAFYVGGDCQRCEELWGIATTRRVLRKSDAKP